jgi:hypothetical protein
MCEVVVVHLATPLQTSREPRRARSYEERPLDTCGLMAPWTRARQAPLYTDVGVSFFVAAEDACLPALFAVMTLVMFSHSARACC